MSLNDLRKTLRKSLREKRQALSQEQQDVASSKLLQQWNTLLSKLQSRSSLTNIALYLANDGELSPHCLADELLDHSPETKRVLFLPSLDGEKLVFARFKRDSEWKTNKFGIKEPVDKQPIHPEQLDLVLLPLVGFDEHGGRLGMGGGFYDKSFAGKKDTQMPILIGIAHECQKVESLPVESWDVPLDGILTPERFILF